MDVFDNTRSLDAATENQTSVPAQGISEKKDILNKYRQQLAKDPRNVGLLNKVGLAAEAAGDDARARWAYKRAIRLDPNHEQSYRNLALLYRKEGREVPVGDALWKYMQRAGDEAKGSAITDAPSMVEKIDDQTDQTHRSLGETPVQARLRKVWEEMELTPAEAMVLLDLEDSDGLQMMQYTLLDLVARRVLESDGRYRIGRGEAYGRTDLAPHEALFAKYFSRISDYVDIDKLARAALAEVDDDGNTYKTAYVRESLLQKGYLEIGTRRIAGFLPAKQVVLSKKGLMAKNRLQRLLTEADRQMALALASNPEQAQAYVEQGGPALLLMGAYPDNQFRRWHEMLTRMGLGPAIEQLRKKARKSDLGTYLDDLLREVLGS